jgi:hypothetical protein
LWPATAQTPPSVSLVSPASGSPVSGTVSVQVTAADDQAVANVKLYARSRGSTTQGVQVGSATQAPYVVSWFTPNHPNLSELEIYAVATDFGANESRSKPVWVKVQNSGVPSLQLLTAFTVPPSETAAPVSAAASPTPVLPDATPERSLILEWQWSPFASGVDGYGVYLSAGAGVSRFLAEGQHDVGPLQGKTKYECISFRTPAPARRHLAQPCRSLTHVSVLF